MKKLIFIIGIVLLIFITSQAFTEDTSSTNIAAVEHKFPTVEYQNPAIDDGFNTEIEEIDESEILQLIDESLGYPGDKRLPKSNLGANDIVLQSMNPSEIYTLINIGLPIARKKVQQSPRYLFYLGRGATFIGYNEGIDWVASAAKHGSEAAMGFLGYYYLEIDQPAEGKKWLQKALQKGFTDDGLVKEILNEMNASKSSNLFEGFNRVDIIQSLYDGDFATLKRNKVITGYYVGVIQNTLNETDILFIVDDPSFLLELDPSISTKLGVISKKAQSFGAVSVGKAGGIISDFLGIKSDQLKESVLITDQAIQDARRLATIYNSDQEFFRKVYSSMVYYSNHIFKS